MNRQIFAWERYSSKLRQEEYWIETLSIAGLFLAALVLFTINLGNLPLRDWDEGTIAQVAKEIWQASDNSLRWIFPTLWGQPYLNKPPLIHGLIALVYSVGGVNEWTTRLPGAFLTACSVPLLYSLGKEIFAVRLPSLLSSLIYLTLLPVVRHGRLAMLDGAVLCFGILLILCVLRSRRDLRWALGAGIAFSLLCLTKGMMGLLLGAIAVSFLIWDTPRLLTSIYFWFGLWLGSIPAIAWYVVQWMHYNQQFTDAIFNQYLERIWDNVDAHQGPIWYYCLEILKYSFPWLIFSLYGVRLAWENRNWSWAKLILVWSGLYLIAVSLMETKLPWYILPIYPALALAGGIALTKAYHLPSYRSYPRAWTIVLGLLALLTTIACTFLYLDITLGWLNIKDHFLLIISGALAFTMSVGTILIAQRDEQFISVLIWGMYISLLLFVSSPSWIWELNEAYPVKPVAEMINKLTAANQVIYTSFAYDRPSLNFYSDRQVISVTPEELIQYWQKSTHPYLLLDPKTRSSLSLESAKTIGEIKPDWVLVTKKAK